MIPGAGELSSELARHHVGGSLDHAPSGSVLQAHRPSTATPPAVYSRAPDRSTRGSDNHASVEKALEILAADQFYRRELRAECIDYFRRIQRSEVDRHYNHFAAQESPDEYVSVVTKWEPREHCELF